MLLVAVTSDLFPFKTYQFQGYFPNFSVVGFVFQASDSFSFRGTTIVPDYWKEIYIYLCRYWLTLKYKVSSLVQWENQENSDTRCWLLFIFSWICQHLKALSQPLLSQPCFCWFSLLSMSEAGPQRWKIAHHMHFLVTGHWSQSENQSVDWIGICFPCIGIKCFLKFQKWVGLSVGQQW